MESVIKSILKAGKDCETCLTNRTQPISCHITPLVNNALGGGHTDTHTYWHENQSNFKKQGVCGQRLHVPGLKISSCNCLMHHFVSASTYTLIRCLLLLVTLIIWLKWKVFLVLFYLLHTVNKITRLWCLLVMIQAVTVCYAMILLYRNSYNVSVAINITNWNSNISALLPFPPFTYNN